MRGDRQNYTRSPCRPVTHLFSHDNKSTRPTASCFHVFLSVWKPRSNTTLEFFIWLQTIHSSLVIRGYCFSALISHESMYFKNNQNAGILLWFVVSHVVVKMAESFAANNESRFVFQKLRKKNQSCCKEAFLSQLPTKPNGRLKKKDQKVLKF